MRPRARRRRPSRRPACGQPAHHRDRQPGGLALDQVAGRGQFVGRGDDGRAQRIAVRVRAAAQIVQHPHPGRADRDVGQPVAPGPPEGVGDDDADVDAERVPQPVADRRAPRRPGPRAATAPCPAGCWRRRPRPRPSPGPAGSRRSAGRRAGPPPAPSPRRSPPRGRPPATIRPSALLTIFEVTSRTSPSGQAAASAAAISLARSSPGRTSGSPGSGPDPVRGHRRADAAHARDLLGQRQRLPGHLARSRPGRSSSAARPGSGSRPPRPRATAPASTVSTSQPSSSPEP